MENVQIENIVMKDKVWAYIAHETISEQYGLREQANYYGGIIADEVAKDRLSVAGLQGCVRWAGTLAREAAALAGDSLESLEGETYAEVLARRLLHSSTKTALKAVSPQRRLVVHRADYRRRCRLLTADTNRGLFQLEARDLGLNGLDDLREQVTLNERTE